MEAVYVDGDNPPTHYPPMSTTTPPTIIAFATPKGGAGKSTSCLTIAGALAAKGHSVHIIDFDVSETLWRWYQKNEAAQAIENISVEKGPAQITAALFSAVWRAPVDYVLLDLAGQLSRPMLRLAVFATLTISPARISEPDIVEANRLLTQLREIQKTVRKPIIHRILMNDVPAIPGNCQQAMLDELAVAELPRFKTTISHRPAAYGEIFNTGLPPHFGNKARATVTNALPEIDALISEIEDLVANVDKFGTIAEATSNQKEAA